MALTELTIRNAKAAEKPYKLADTFGLYLYVAPSGSRLWRYDYVFAGRRKTMALGRYPDTGLANARSARDEAKRLIAEGLDPLVKKKLDKIADEIGRANTFESICDELLARLEEREPPLAPITLAKKRWILKEIVCPEIGKRPIADIKAAELLVILRRLESAGKRETARRARSTISAVFRHAITTLRAEHDPTYVLRDAILPPKVTHMAAIVNEADFGNLISSIEEYTGWPVLRECLRFTAYTFSRPGEVRLAKWNEFDLKEKVWEIPAARMKMRRVHHVPLSPQAMGILSAMRETHPKSEWVFPSLRTIEKPLSENAMNSALRRMGYTKEEMTSHGFRSSASTILNGRGFDPEVIEMQLSHVDANTIRRAYNRNTFWDERVKLMHRWANIIDCLALA
ncbi:integrase arm-type DNA-binding domain-containing protein [Ochrobactrum sp. BTU2]|uniref:tyrosine-type recombinase/integrase n=1 Tax=Ochrobactrum sp. BTU2 TaxID=2856166 RepID=UPI002119F6DE|nr:integrase arm-type DNA-binding domain-containing protein [Ochrobactrum sp. BTU2]MCQ9146035.1 tyrosine-type recombinase/integrase [Ochrobactrum sp. BTU2]